MRIEELAEVHEGYAKASEREERIRAERAEIHRKLGSRRSELRRQKELAEDSVGQILSGASSATAVAAVDEIAAEVASLQRQERDLDAALEVAKSQAKAEQSKAARAYARAKADEHLELLTKLHDAALAFHEAQTEWQEWRADLQHTARTDSVWSVLQWPQVPQDWAGIFFSDCKELYDLDNPLEDR